MPVFTHRFLRAWPNDGAKETLYLPVSEVLTRTFETDVHFAQYSCPTHPYRLRRDAYDHLLEPPEMVLMVFDIDSHDAHVTGEEASDAWFAAEKKKIDRLLQSHPGGYAYRTRGGYRLVYLAGDRVIASEQDALAHRLHYVSAAVHLAEEFGIVVDPTCKPWAWLFRAPRATRAGGMPEARQSFGDPAAIGVWVHSAGDLEHEQKVAEQLPLKEPTWKNAVAEYRRVLQAKNPLPRSRTRHTAPARPLSAPEHEELALALSKPLSLVLDGRHRLYLALSGALLSRGVAPDVLPALVRRGAELAGDAEALRRANDAASTARTWARGAPVIGYSTLRMEWPEVATALDALLPQRAAHVSVQPPLPEHEQEAPPICLDDALPELRRRLEQALSAPKITVISIPPGVGKSRVAMEAAISTAKRVAFVYPTNDVAKSQYLLGAGLAPDEVARRYGVLATVDERGEPICHKADLARTIQAAGMPVPQRLCLRCEHREGCRARDGREGAARPRVMVMNHAMMEPALEHAGAGGALVIDETPALFVHTDVQIAELRSVAGTSRSALARGFSGPAEPMLELVVDAGDTADDGEELLASLRRAATAREAEEGWKFRLAAAAAMLPSGSDPELDQFDQPRLARPPEFSGYFESALAIFRAASSCWPNHPVPPTTRDTARELARGPRDRGAALAAASRVLAVMRRMLDQHTEGAAPALAKWKVDKTRGVSLEITELEPVLLRALKRTGPTVIMDATPDLAALGAISPRDVVTYQQAVADGAPVHRTLLSVRGAAKRYLAPHGQVNWARFGPLLSESLVSAGATAGKNVLLITHKACAEALRQCGVHVPHARLARILRRRQQAGAATAIAHYGAIKGKNEFDGIAWSELDAVVTVGDPWPDIGRARRENELLGLGGDIAERRTRQLAAAELAQAHGRLRAPRQTKAVRAVHAGRVAPLGWHQGNCDAATLPEGRPVHATEMTLDELRVHVTRAGGRRALARRVGCSPSTIRRYLAGRAVPLEMASKIRNGEAAASA